MDNDLHDGLFVTYLVTFYPHLESNPEAAGRVELDHPFYTDGVFSATKRLESAAVTAAMILTREVDGLADCKGAMAFTGRFTGHPLYQRRAHLKLRHPMILAEQVYSEVRSLLDDAAC